MAMVQTFPTGSGSGSGSNNGFYKTTDSITTTIDATTTLDITNISGLSISDVIIGETIVYDNLGTNAVVTTKDTTNNTIDVKTISTGGTTNYHIDRSGQELLSAYAKLDSAWTPTVNTNVPLVLKSGNIIQPSTGLFTIPDGTRVEFIYSASSNPIGDTSYNLYNNTDSTYLNDIANIDPYKGGDYLNSPVLAAQWTNNTGHSVDISIRVQGSTVTSTLIGHTSLSIKEIGRIVDPIQYTANNDELEETPVGNIISYMGNSVPKHHLACDGTEYAIGTYPELEAHIIKEFGSINYFGGDGTTTWAVPDLNGEFLRGTGTNSHTNQGSGANVGEHQDATVLNDVSSGITDGNMYITSSNTPSTNKDSVIPMGTLSYVKGNTATSSDWNRYTSRPTNTSVKYCIKYESTYHIIIPSHMYKVSATFDLAWDSSNSAYLLSNLTFQEGDQSLIDGDFFKAPLTGWYSISFNSAQASSKTQPIMQYIQVTHNGTMTSYADGGDSGSATSWWGLSTTRTLYLEKGDTVNLRVWSKGAQVTIPSDRVATFCLLTANYKDNIIAGGEVYSLEEQVIGTWTDGKPLYQKTIDCGTLPNTDKKVIAHGISNIEKVVRFNATAEGTTGGILYAFSIPNVGINNQYAYDIALDITGANIDITTQENRSWLKGRVTLQYTKTTDTAGTYQYKNSLLLTRPDLWTPNTEIDFGGGLYGYRAKGNMPAIAAGNTSASIWSLSNKPVSSTSIVSYGGMIKVHNGNNIVCGRTIGYQYSTANKAELSFFQIVIDATSNIKMDAMMGTDYSTTSDTYDVWVTYTK